MSNKEDKMTGRDRPAHSLIRIRDAILNTLSAQQAKRDQYDGTEWIAAERKVMLDETNEWRALLGKPPVDIAAIERVERWATGHSDYSSKFALYCAEIALDTGPGAP